MILTHSWILFFPWTGSTPLVVWGFTGTPSGTRHPYGSGCSRCRFLVRSWGFYPVRRLLRGNHRWRCCPTGGRWCGRNGTVRRHLDAVGAVPGGGLRKQSEKKKEMYCQCTFAEIGYRKKYLISIREKLFFSLVTFNQVKQALLFSWKSSKLCDHYTRINWKK